MLGLDIRSLKNHLWVEEHSTFVITSKRSMMVSEQQEHPRVLRPPRGKLFSLLATYHIKTHGLWMSPGGWRHCRIMQLQFQLLLGEIMIQLMRPQNKQFIDVHSMQISPLQIPTVEHFTAFLHVHLHLTNGACLEDTTCALMPIPCW